MSLLPHRAGLLPEEAVSLLGHLGVDLRVGRQLLLAAVGRGECDLNSIRDVAKAKLKASPAIHRKSNMWHSPDVRYGNH